VLEGVPQRISVFREAPAGNALLWAVVAGAVVLDLTTLRESQEQRLIIVGALSMGSLLVYAIIRLLISRGMASEKVHDVVVQLAGFLVLFLGIVALFALARALTDRGFAATMAVFHGSWALGALDGYRRGRQPNPQQAAEAASSLPSTIPLEPDSEWKIETGDYRLVFEALKELVGSTATLCIIGTTDQGVIRLLTTLSTPPTYRLGDVGTWWPQPRVFHIPATGLNLAQLAATSDRYAQPEFMEHLVVYETGRNVVEWWDAPDDPIHVASTVSEDAVRRFAAHLGAAVVRG